MNTIYTLIIPDRGRRRVLLVPQDHHWTMPELQFEQRYFWQVVGHINAAVHQQFGLDVTTLRCRSILPPTPDTPARLVYEIELHRSYEAPFVVGRWATPDDIDDLPEAQRSLLTAWWDEAAQPAIRPGGVPWYRPGWRDTMLPWLTRALEQAGRRCTGPVEQVRSWERSALWSVPTDQGIVFFKAVPSIFGHEAALTAWLAERFAACSPPVLAIDSARGWLLMGDAGSLALINHTDIERWEAALGAYARMQIVLSRQIDDLRTLGVPDHSLSWLQTGLERLLADSDGAGGAAGLTAEEVAVLRQLEPELRSACRRWERIGLPLSLEHGDFSAWQVQIDGDDNRILDWSDSSVAPPFFSMLGVLGDIPAALLAVPDAAARLRGAYLGPWAELVPSESVREAFDIAQRLAPLHHALIYHADVLRSMEQRWELEAMVPYYLRMLLSEQPID